MKYQRFEELPVWKAAIELAVQIYALVAKPTFKGHGALRDQMERAVVSISNNVAEGFEKGHHARAVNVSLYLSRFSG